ncbi:metal ABC transporter ATP-binding protein [Candidatus Similichlamydia epinepheli]|uniref:metal ABC transporter ATP-binding protein n=1 Tax=Candidatus Similichlamydia epinepheli TaxID=1903953 RepID=UPI000D3317DE|nr:ATP-binding cassette domain-containing protein [Candidatus Similichlamydia epinepheli]
MNDVENTGLVVSNLSLFLGRKILSRISFQVTPGNPLGLIGPNGGGKTSLIRIVAGLLSPTEGEVHLMGKKSTIGYVPQNLERESDLPLSTLEFVAMGHTSQRTVGWRLSNQQIEMAKLALASVELIDKQEERVFDLSGGQLQRAALARAIVKDPDVLLLDEPTTNSDPQSKRAIMGILNRMKKNVIVLIASHDRELLQNLCTDYLCVQCNGLLLREEEVFSHFLIGAHS